MRLNESIAIEGRAVILVPYKEHHVRKYHNWMKSEELQHLTASEPLSLEEEYEMQKSWHTDEDKCTFIVLDNEVLKESANESDAMIGDTNLFLSAGEPHEAEAEIMIAEKNARGKKKGWEAMLLMLRYGTEELNVKTYVAKIKQDNLSSIKMFTKIGFTEVYRSDVFGECTFKISVNEEWNKWLCSETNFYKKVLYDKIKSVNQ